MGDTKPTAKTRSTITGAQKDILDNTIIPILIEALNALPPELIQSLGTAQFGGQVPGPTDLQQLSLTGLEQLGSGGLAQGRDPRLAAGRDTGLSAINTINELLNPDPAVFDEFFRTSVADPLQEIFREDTIPTIQAATAQQPFGSSRGGAEERAAETLIEELVRSRSTLGFQNRGLQLAAAQAAPGVAAGAFAPEAFQNDLLNALFQSGQGFRGIETEQLGFEFTEFQRRLNQVKELLGLSTSTAVSPTQQTVGLAGQKGLLSDVIGAFEVNIEG